MQPTIEIIPLINAQSDARNANQGTQRGKEMLKTSLSKFGAGRSILLDKNLKIIAGNKTQENAVEMGIEEMIVVHTTGDKLVAVVRDDLDIDEQSGREMAYADNRIAEIDLNWNYDTLKDDVNSGIDLGDLWDEFTLNALIHNQSPQPKEFDETIANEVQYHECPSCGHKWPK